MHIDDDHMYHGAALIQIAEDPNFTAINALDTAAGTVHNAFRINTNIALYLKYATKPTPSHKEYPFTFADTQLAELEAVSNVALKLFIGLVCVKDRQICCLPYADLKKLVERRRKANDADEDQYVVLVTLPASSAFRVYVNTPGKRNLIEGTPIKVARNAFPAALFA